LGGLDESGVETIVEVVGVVGDLVGEVGDLGFEGGAVDGGGFAAFGRGGREGVFVEAFKDFEGEVEAGEVGVFDLDGLDDAEALLVVVEATVGTHEAVELRLTRMAEWGVAEIVGEGDGLGKVLIEGKGAGDGTRDGNDLDGVGEAGTEVIAGAAEEDLCFVLETAEGA
jgi:hypothetical protein